MSLPGSCLAEDTVASIRSLRYEDGLTHDQIRELTGVCRESIRKYAPGRFVGKVSNSLARELFVASGRSACSVALDMGWVSPGRGGRIRGDGSRLLRTLGLQPERHRTGRGLRRMIDAEVAGMVAEACGCEAWEAIPDEEVAA